MERKPKRTANLLAAVSAAGALVSSCSTGPDIEVQFPSRGVVLDNTGFVTEEVCYSIDIEDQLGGCDALYTGTNTYPVVDIGRCAIGPDGSLRILSEQELQAAAGDKIDVTGEGFVDDPPAVPENYDGVVARRMCGNELYVSEAQQTQAAIGTIFEQP